MTDIEQRALDLLNESRIAFGLSETDIFFRNQTPENEALCRALQRQETAMTSELIEKIEALAKDATPGPWEACEPGDYGDFDGDSRVMCGDDKRIAVFHWDERYAEGNNADIELSVALRNNLPTILRALREQGAGEQP